MSESEKEVSPKEIKEQLHKRTNNLLKKSLIGLGSSMLIFISSMVIIEDYKKSNIPIPDGTKKLIKSGKTTRDEFTTAYEKFSKAFNQGAEGKTVEKQIIQTQKTLDSLQHLQLVK